MTNYEFFRNKHFISKKISSERKFGYSKHCKGDEKWEIILKGFSRNIDTEDILTIIEIVLHLNNKVILDFPNKHLQISIDILQNRFSPFDMYAL